MRGEGRLTFEILERSMEDLTVERVVKTNTVSATADGVFILYKVRARTEHEHHHNGGRSLVWFGLVGV